MTALAKWGALHEVLDPPSSSLPGLTGSRGNVADEEELCSIMSARCWMPSSMPMAKNFATTIECVYSVCFLIVIGEAAARGERAEGSVATGTPFCRSGLLRSGSAGYCAAVLLVFGAKVGVSGVPVQTEVARR